MIRLTALVVYVAVLALYARKDWYVSLCGLILMAAALEHPDMPKSIFGIQGLNPWNLLLMIVVAAWLRSRRREQLTWDMPRAVMACLALYAGIIGIGFVRMMVDRSYLYDQTTASLISEYFVNTFKWVIPGMLLFDGCRSRKRFYMAVASILGVYVLLALYVIKWMPLGLLMSGDELQRRAVKILVNEIGYHRVNMSMMLAGASWAIFAARYLVQRWSARLWIVGAALVVVYGQALTAGRMGYVTWGAVGVVLCLIRGRKLLLAAPVLVVGILLLVPAVGERMLQGFEGSAGPNMYEVTAGRTLIWPYVVRKIEEAPIVGYGRLGMRRTGLATMLHSDLEEGFEHPHNAYFELLLDNGIIGFAIVIPIYLTLLLWSLGLYGDARSPIFIAIGGISGAFVLALLVAAGGSQTFYPREGALGMWCAAGLLLRVRLERARAVDLLEARTEPEREPTTSRVGRGPARWRRSHQPSGRGRLPRAGHPRHPTNEQEPLDELLWSAP